MRHRIVRGPLALLENWPVEPREVKQFGDVFSVRAKDERYVLKPLNKHRRRARYICGLTEYLSRGEEPLTPAIMRTRTGALMVSEHPTKHWILCQWVHGRIADWEHLGDVLHSTEALARFHLAARGYEQRPNERPRAYWGVWPEKLAQRRRAIRDCAAMARERLQAETGTRFDEIVVSESAGQLALADESLATLGAAEYTVLCSRYQALSQVVHGDPAGRNFVCTEYGQVRIIDLETVRQDIPAADLSKLLRRVLKKHHWNRGVAQAVLERYQSVLPLEPEMMPLVYALVAFPTKFYRDLYRYCEDRQSWSLRRHLHKFRKHLRYERGRPELLRQLRGAFRPSSDPREDDDGEISG